MSIKKGSLVEIKDSGVRLYVLDVTDDSVVQLCYVSPSDMIVNIDKNKLDYFTKVAEIHVSHLILVSNFLNN